MTASRPRYLLYALLAASLLLNVATLGSLARSGGLRRIFVRMDLAELPRTREPFQKETEARFRSLPNAPGEVVFLGDSQVAGGPWSELYGPIRNRGIGGDTASALLGRVDEVTESRPREVFLLIGTNDLAAGVPPAQLARHYRALLERIRKDSPRTAINMIAILPVNPTIGTKLTYGNAQIANANGRLKQLAAEFPGVNLIDLNNILADPGGNLRREFTPDGIHLNHDAYLAIREPLARLSAGGGLAGAAGPAATP